MTGIFDMDQNELEAYLAITETEGFVKNVDKALEDVSDYHARKQASFVPSDELLRETIQL